jgi:hypothetical protein
VATAMALTAVSSSVGVVRQRLEVGVFGSSSVACIAVKELLLGSV